jgi:hypothetical protein
MFCDGTLVHGKAHCTPTPPDICTENRPRGRWRSTVRSRASQLLRHFRLILLFLCERPHDSSRAVKVREANPFFSQPFRRRRSHPLTSFLDFNPINRGRQSQRLQPLRNYWETIHPITYPLDRFDRFDLIGKIPTVWRVTFRASFHRDRNSIHAFGLKFS